MLRKASSCPLRRRAGRRDYARCRGEIAGTGASESKRPALPLLRAVEKSLFARGGKGNRMDRRRLICPTAPKRRSWSRACIGHLGHRARRSGENWCSASIMYCAPWTTAPSRTFAPHRGDGRLPKDGKRKLYNARPCARGLEPLHHN